MRVKRGYLASGAVAIAAMAVALSPAMGAAGAMMAARSDLPVSLARLGSIGSFTPITRDQRLAAAYEKAVLSGARKSFRFTPTSGSMSGRRSITVLVRAGDNGDRADRSVPGVSITPVAFNLDLSRGWRKFALPESVGKRDLDEAPVVTLSGNARSFTLDTVKKSRFSTNVLVDAKHDAGTGVTLGTEKPYSLDVASSYSLTRNVNVTAGVRYRGSMRLAPMTDDRQDSQAVYLGTVFKF
ncbi:hypothetical protein [Sphingobium aquiterrae]|uniref:hypothetical protein n=1 Tax=Sphingobium aquiterrae TaxID=2038656 RepID=UPI003018AD29